MNPTITTPATTPDFTAIKTRQRAAWSSGDYRKIGSTLQIVGEQLAEALRMRPDARVLDVAAGNGNITLAMARRWCKVTSTDYCAELLERGRQRAEAEGLEVEFQLADAEQLPFADGSFDAVVSTFGVMFAPDQEAAARELLRVCRSGGRIGMANWTPSSFIGGLFRAIGRHLAPPAGVKSPALWGDRAWIATHFGAEATAIAIEVKHFDFVYRSPQHFVDFFRAFYGPVEKAFLALDAEGQAALEADMLALVAQGNVATDGTMRVPGEYVEVVVTRR
jgi:SAM-dependent methyltransferase